MASQSFTPIDVVDMSKERDWPANIGMMDWDNTSIVFTKRTLIQFLKYTGFTVDTNFVNISKLPKYATFGKISNEGIEDTKAEETIATTQEQEESTVEQNTSSFRPSRRVRSVPGGAHQDIFEEEFPDDALAQAPGPVKTKDSTTLPTSDSKNTEEPISGASGIRPSRRVRTAPGGKDNIAGIWGTDEPEEKEFKPTRRVRQGPGGQDSIGDLFGPL